MLTTYESTGIAESFSDISLPPEFFEHLFDLTSYVNDHIHIASVYNGVKPGTTFTDPEIFKGDSSLLTLDDLESTELHMLLQQYDIPFRYDVLETDESKHISYYLWNNSKVYTNLPDATGYEKVVDWERDNSLPWAKFLGIPEPDISWWKNYGYDSLSDINEFDCIIEDEFIFNNQMFLNITPHMEQPTKESLRRSIGQGQAYYGTYQWFCDAYELECSDLVIVSHNPTLTKLVKP